MVGHHAVLLESKDPLADILARYVPRTVEVYVLQKRSIGIPEARLLIEEALRTPFESEYRVIAVEVESFTSEAQNALLKVLEEPPSTTRFLFIVRESVFLLPTLRSRFLVEYSQAQGSNDSFFEFKTLTIPERLRFIAERIEKKDDVWIAHLRTGLEAYLTDHQPNITNVSLYRRLGYVATKIGTRGASSKMLLEELAFMLPIV